VDDTIGGGTPALFDAMSSIGSVLKIDAEESAKDGPFLYVGLRISTCPITHGKRKGKFAITVDGNEYLQATKEMDVPSGDANDFLSPLAATEFHSVAGCFAYMAFSFRPELAVECSMLGRVFLSLSITDARKVNATLAGAKVNPYVLKYLFGTKRGVRHVDLVTAALVELTGNKVPVELVIDSNGTSQNATTTR
jgi:hypothetical protein